MKLQGKHHRQVMGFVAWILGLGLTPLAQAEVQGSVQIQAGWNLVAAPANPEHRCAWTGLGLTLWAGAGGIERSEQISCKPESLDPTARASEPSDEARVVWVFARNELELPIAGSPSAAWVPAGWNMLAVSEETIYGDPNILRISRWEAQTQGYKKVRLGGTLKVGYGYLAFLEKAGAPFQDDCLGSKWTLETARTLIETCPFSGPTPNGPAPRPLDPALPTHIVLEPATEDSTARGARHDPGSVAPDFKNSAHFTVTQTASGAWNIIENQPPGAQLPPLLRIHIHDRPQGSDASLSEINPELPQKGAVLRVAELIAELSERFSPIEGVVWDERGSGAWMSLIDALQRRFFGPGVAARPPTEPGAFEAPAAVSRRGLFVALPKVALVTHDDRTWAHLVHVLRPGRSQNFEVAYRRSKKAAQDRSFETTKTLAAPGDGWAITDLAIAARGDKVSVAWTQTQTGPKTQPKQSLIGVTESHDRGAHFLAPKTVRKNDAWKRGLSLGYDRFGHLHLVWGEAHKAYYLKDFTKEPENVFDVVVREKNDLVVSYALAHKNPLCRKPMAPCGCIEWSHEAYSYALETNPKTGEAFGPYRTRTEEAFVYNPSLTIDDDAVSIIAHQDRMWDNRAVPNPDWPLEKNVTPEEAGGTCPKPGTRIAQAGFQKIWQKRAHDLEPQRHPEETPGTNPSGPQEGAGSDTLDNKTHHQYLYDGTWHEEDQIRIAQRPLVEDTWSEPSTGMRDVPVWPMREGLLEWKTAEVPVEEGFKVGTFQNGVRQDWRHAVVAQLQSPLHEGRHDAPKLALKKPGHLVAVYSDGPSGKAHIPSQNPIFVTQSLDGGITWSRGIQVAHGYLPDAAATHDGEVGLLVYRLGAPGHATPPAPKIDMLRTRDLQVWERDTLNLYPPTPIHRIHHENGAHHPDLFDDPIGVPALSGHQALFVATWVRSEIDPQKGTRIVTTRAARAPETRRYEITHTGPLTVGQSTQFTITAVNAYDMRVHDDGKVHLGVASRGPGGISQRSPHAGTNQGSPHAGTNQGSPHEGTSPAANPTFRSENAQALALVEGRSPPATVQLQNGQATFVRLTTETDTTLLVQSEENPTGRASATTLLAYASGAAGNYQRAIEARDRMMRTVVDEATQQTWVFQVEYAPEASPQPGDETTGLASPLEESGMASDARYLASFERVWVYTQGIAVAQLSKQQDTVSQAAAQGMARYLCAHAEKGHHEGRTVILGWPFSWNTAGDNWKDRRLVTGANAWAVHGLGAFVVSKAFDSLSDKEQRAIRGCYEEAIRGLLVHRRRLVAPGTDQTVSLVTAGWTARGLTVAENPSALFTEEEESVQWGYYSVLDAIGYEAFTEDRAPEVARFRHTPGAPPTKLEPRVLTEEDHQRLKTRVLANNVVTEHNLDVLSVLNHALRHQEKIGLQDFAELEVFRDELRDGIFVLLWDDQEYTQDLAYTLRQIGPDDPRRLALEEALEAQDLGRIVTGGHFSGTGEDLHFSASNHVAIDNCSWLSLSVDHGLLPEQPEYIERLARCLRYTELQFVKPLPFAGRTYLGAHYFQNTFRDPYISPSALQESSYHLEATTGLILGLARFARAYPEHPDAGHFADQTRALWNGVQLFVKDHGFRYSSQRIQDLSTRLASSTAAIWFIDVYRELNQDWAGLRGIVGTGRVWDPERLAASSLAHKNVVSLGLYGGHEAFVGFQSQSGATWVDTKAPRSDDSVGPIYPEAQSTFGPGARATKPGTVLANVIKKGAASIDEFSPGTSFATSQLLAAGTALASIVALSTGQVETWTTLIHLNQAPNVHTEPWTFVGTVPEDEVTFLGLFFKDEALIRHTRIQQSHVQGGFATSTVEFEADAIYGLVKEVYGPSEGMLKDLYRLGLPTGEPISVYRLDTELSPEAIVDAVLDQQVPWLKPSADPAPNEPDFTADLFRELKALALTPDFHQIDLAELIHTLENQGAAPDSHDAQAIIPESPLGTAWLDQVPEAFRASVYYWTVLLPQYVAPQSSGPLWDALQNDLSRLDEDTCRTLGPVYVSRFPGAQVGWVPGSGNVPGRCVLTQATGANPTQSGAPEPDRGHHTSTIKAFEGEATGTQVPMAGAPAPPNPPVDVGGAFGGAQKLTLEELYRVVGVEHLPPELMPGQEGAEAAFRDKVRQAWQAVYAPGSRWDVHGNRQGGDVVSNLFARIGFGDSLFVDYSEVLVDRQKTPVDITHKVAYPPSLARGTVTGPEDDPQIWVAYRNDWEVPVIPVASYNPLGGRSHRLLKSGKELEVSYGANFLAQNRKIEADSLKAFGSLVEHAMFVPMGRVGGRVRFQRFVKPVMKDPGALHQWNASVVDVTKIIGLPKKAIKDGKYLDLNWFVKTFTPSGESAEELLLHSDEVVAASTQAFQERVENGHNSLFVGDFVGQGRVRLVMFTLESGPEIVYQNGGLVVPTVVKPSKRLDAAVVRAFQGTAFRVNYSYSASKMLTENELFAGLPLGANGSLTEGAYQMLVRRIWQWVQDGTIDIHGNPIGPFKNSTLFPQRNVFEIAFGEALTSGSRKEPSISLAEMWIQEDSEGQPEIRMAPIVGKDYYAIFVLSSEEMRARMAVAEWKMSQHKLAEIYANSEFPTNVSMPSFRGLLNRFDGRFDAEDRATKDALAKTFGEGWHVAVEVRGEKESKPELRYNLHSKYDQSWQRLVVNPVEARVPADAVLPDGTIDLAKWMEHLRSGTSVLELTDEDDRIDVELVRLDKADEHGLVGAVEIVHYHNTMHSPAHAPVDVARMWEESETEMRGEGDLAAYPPDVSYIARSMHARDRLVVRLNAPVDGTVLWVCGDEGIIGALNPLDLDGLRSILEFPGKVRIFAAPATGFSENEWGIQVRNEGDIGGICRTVVVTDAYFYWLLNQVWNQDAPPAFLAALRAWRLTPAAIPADLWAEFGRFKYNKANDVPDELVEAFDLLARWVFLLEHGYLDKRSNEPRNIESRASDPFPFTLSEGVARIHDLELEAHLSPDGELVLKTDPHRLKEALKNAFGIEASADSLEQIDLQIAVLLYEANEARPVEIIVQGGQILFDLVHTAQLESDSWGLERVDLSVMRKDGFSEAYSAVYRRGSDGVRVFLRGQSASVAERLRGKSEYLVSVIVMHPFDPAAAIFRTPPTVLGVHGAAEE